MHLSSLPHLCQEWLLGLKCSKAVSHRCALRVLITLLKLCWLQEAAKMAAQSEDHVPSEQHDAELLATRLSMELIDEAAQSMEDSFATGIGGREACLQPVLLVCNTQDAEKTVKSAEPKRRSWFLP